MSNKTKKISYMTALVILVASTIGAGIFFKNGTIFANSDGSLGLAIASWVISAIGIIAIGLSLIEISSASKNDKGILAWVKNFAPKWVSKYSVNYVLLIYLPLNYVAMPLYAVMSIQDATNDTWMANPWVVVGISFGIFAWISSMGFFTLKVSEKFSWIFTAMKFIPLFIAPFITINNSSSSDIHSVVSGSVGAAEGITHFSGWLGLMASIPAILFAYDGFYTVTSLKSDMEDPKKMGPLIAVGISLITAGYLFFAVLTGIFGQTDIFGSSYSEFTIAFMNSLIFMAILGIINSFAMTTPRMYMTSFAEGDFNLLLWFKRTFRIKTLKMASFLISVIIAVLFWIVLTPIGIYAIEPTSYQIYGDGTAQLYVFADLLTNFTSLAMFMIIGVAIVGGLVNRKTNKTKVVKYKWFLPAAWVSTIFLGIGTLYFIIQEFALAAGLNVSSWDSQVSYIVQLGIVIFTLGISAIPLFIPANNKKYKLDAEEERETNLVLDGGSLDEIHLEKAQ